MASITGIQRFQTMEAIGPSANGEITLSAVWPGGDTEALVSLWIGEVVTVALVMRIAKHLNEYVGGSK